jgi:DNA-binding NtrC family response regulator
MNNLKILLIDDDQWIRDSLSMYLQEEGCSIIALETAEEGIEEMAHNLFDVVIASYRLPGINGLRFLQKVNAMQPNSVQILITAYRDKKVKSEAHRIGVHGIIDKPISAKILESSLSHLLSKKKARTKGAVQHERLSADARDQLSNSDADTSASKLPCSVLLLKEDEMRLKE